MENKLIFEIVKNELTKIQNTYSLKESKKRFLSEDDFKCQFFGMIHKSLIENNLEDKYSVHSEISFYNKENRLRYRPDISIIENKYFEMGNKSFDWTLDSDGASVLIEIKFIKKANSKVFDNINKDMEKLSLLSNLNEKLKSFMICFDFTGKAYQNRKYPSTENVEFRYAPNKLLERNI